jgi:tetratricopeptide (TPR) repeat protein
MMEVPYKLRRRSSREPTAALLLPSPDVAELLAVCSLLSTKALPTIYHVADGLLIVLHEPTDGVLPGAFRLRALATNLYLPADADLSPALARDEATALTRERGLVFLPGSRVLAFDVRKPVACADLVHVDKVQKEGWEPLPACAPLAERLASLTLDLPEQSVESIFEAAGKEIGEKGVGGPAVEVDLPLPENARPVDQAAGTLQMAVGKALIWLGKAFRIRPLAALGAQWMAGAMERVPRLSETVLGKQEAALRALLREFRAGKLEQALRRALPLADSTGRGNVAASDANLPTHDTRFSLANLFAGLGGPASHWFGGGDVMNLLVQEYHRAARDAARRGDYRRAAFIYGTLLRQYPLAAAALSQGGHHHEAALIYLKKVGNRASAAREFEAAGEFERALELYRELTDYKAAGDLLRRIGEEEAALAEYRQAADALLEGGNNYLAAGEFLLKMGGQPRAARRFFRLGWAKRSGDDSLACVLRLLHLHTEDKDGEAVGQLVEEADPFFAGPASEHTASKFYNELVRLAEHDHLETMRADLRDRALLGLAAKLRQRRAGPVSKGMALSALFDPKSGWSTALISDADRAVRTEVADLPRQLAPAHVQLALGRVTAVACAADTGAVFVGLQDGSIACFDPKAGTHIAFPNQRRPFGPVTALAVDPKGQLAVALRVLADGTTELATYHSSQVLFVADLRRTLDEKAIGLTDVIFHAGTPRVGVWDSNGLEELSGARLLPVSQTELPFDEKESIAFLVSRSRWGEAEIDLFCTGGGDFHVMTPELPEWTELRLNWEPGPPPVSLRLPTLSRLQGEGGCLELAGVNESRQVCWSLLQTDGGYGAARSVRSTTESYLAVCLMGLGQVAAVRKAGIDWLFAAEDRFVVRGRTHADLSRAVACFASTATGELLVVCHHGALLRVPAPR